MANEELLQKKKRLLELKKQLSQQKSVIHEPEATRLDAIARFGRQGLTFGFGDEIESVFQGAKSALTTPGSLSDRGEAFNVGRQSSMVNSEILRNDQRKLFPFTAGISEGVGGAVTGGSTFNLLRQPLRNLPGALRLPAIGAVEGAAFGAGTAQPGERAKGALGGTIIGGAGTPVVAGLGNAAMGVLRPVARRLGESLFGTPRNRAVKEIMKALDADDITPDEATALMRMMGRNSTLADLGETLGRQGRVVTSELGPASSQARRFLDARQRMSQMNLRQVARRATGSNSFDKGIVEIINGAESKAGPIYDEVYSTVLDVTQPMLEILKRPSMIAARRKASTLLKDEGFSTDIIDDITDVRYMDGIKRGLDDMISASRRAGNGNRERVLTKLKNEFVDQIDNQVPRYAEARSVFAGEANIREASEIGRTMFANNRARVADIAEQIGGMGESELTAARLGFLDWLAEETARQSTTRNTLVNKFADVPRFRQLTEMLFPNRQAVDDFLNTASAQAQFARTRNTVTGGSPTARIQSDRGALTNSALGLAAEGAVSPISALGRAMSLVTSDSKLTPDVLEEMGNILFNPRIIPNELRPSRFLSAFDLPKLDPVTRAGVAGGITGSQQEQVPRINLQGLLGQTE